MRAFKVYVILTCPRCKNEARHCECSLSVTFSSRPNYANETQYKPRQHGSNDGPRAVPAFQEFECMAFIVTTKSENPLDPFSLAFDGVWMSVRVVHLLKDEVIE